MLAVRLSIPAGIESRTATITLTDGFDTITLKVTQKAQPVHYDVTHVTLLVNMILGTEQPDKTYDFDGDGELNVSDVSTLVNFILDSDQ